MSLIPFAPFSFSRSKTAWALSFMDIVSKESLPQSSAETLVKIIKGYAVASTGGQLQVNYKDVASVAGISPTIVSGNNRFLLESEILTSPKFGFYVPTEGAIRFARESAWDEPGAKTHLRGIVLATWYGQVAVQNFALRSTLTKEELKRALAIKSGATEGDSTALDFLIDFLIYTGIVVEREDGTLGKGEVDGNVTATLSTTVPASGLQATATVTTPTVTTPQKTIAVTVHVHIQRPEQLTEEYADRVKQWLRMLESEGDKLEISIDAADHENLELAG
jgi:hypothetical protein